MSAQSTRRLFMIVVLVIVGRMLLMASSFLAIPAAVYRGIDDPMAVRAGIGIVVAIAIIFGALLISRAKDQWRYNAAVLLAHVVGFGCIGLVRVVLYRWFVDRNGGYTGPGDAVILGVAVSGLGAILFLVRNKRRTRKRNRQIA